MRLDTTTTEGATWVIERGFHVELDDPGASDLIDLCETCVVNDDLFDIADVEHPPYEDDLYVCANCGVALTSDDD